MEASALVLGPLLHRTGLAGHDSVLRGSAEGRFGAVARSCRQNRTGRESALAYDLATFGNSQVGPFSCSPSSIFEECRAVALPPRLPLFQTNAVQFFVGADGGKAAAAQLGSLEGFAHMPQKLRHGSSSGYIFLRLPLLRRKQAFPARTRPPYPARVQLRRQAHLPATCSVRLDLHSH